MKPRCEDCRTDQRTALCRLEESGWASFLQARTLHQFKTRQTIFHEGTPASTIYILCEGEVKLSLTTGQGTSKIIRLVSASSSPCEILDKPALGTLVHSVTCETIADSQIACLSTSRFSWLMKRDPTFVSLVMKTLIDELGTYLRTFREETAAPARRRLASLLVSFAQSNGSGMLMRPADSHSDQGVETEFTLPVRRQELADMLGTSRETVARLLSRLGRDRIIAFKGRRIRILASDRLRSLAKTGSTGVTTITSDQ